MTGHLARQKDKLCVFDKDQIIGDQKHVKTKMVAHGGRTWLS